MCTDPLIPVPRLVRHGLIYPRCSSCANLATFSIWVHAFDNLVNTAPRSAPFCNEMILSWSFSLTYTKNVLLLLRKIPLASGQSLFMPHASKNLSPSLNRKWSSVNCFLSYSVNEERAWYLPANSPSNVVSALTTNYSICFLYSLDKPGPRGKSARFLPILILVLLIILASSSWNSGAWSFVKSMSLTCLAFGLWP